MSQTLTIELSDEVYAALRRQAETAGLSPAHLAAASLEQQFAQARAGDGAARVRGRSARHFGTVDLGHPTGADNESIDADLGRECAEPL